MKNYVVLFVVCVFIGSSVGAQSKKEQKSIKAAREFEQMKAVIESLEFDFLADWAYPLQGTRVNLTTNANFLRFRKDSADIYLPYFGTLYGGNSAITGQGGIVFQGIVNDLTVASDDTKQKVTVNFTAVGKNDNFQFSMTVFHSGNTVVNVYSNYRSNIKYNGKTKQAKTND